MSVAAPDGPGPTVNRDKVRGAVARFMVEDHTDWGEIWEQELAQLLGVQPGDEPWTWHWEQHTLEGLEHTPGIPGSTDDIW